MEEADALCDRIGIMAYGRMRCLGSSLHLKAKFGGTTKIDVTHKPGKADDAAAFVNLLVGGARHASAAGSDDRPQLLPACLPAAAAAACHSCSCLPVCVLCGHR